MGTTFASELLRELNNSSIDEFFIQANPSLDQSGDNLLNFSQLDMAFIDEDIEVVCPTDDVQFMTYPNIAS